MMRPRDAHRCAAMVQRDLGAFFNDSVQCGIGKAKACIGQKAAEFAFLVE